MDAAQKAVERARASDRYERRRLAIIAAATELLNTHGVRGMRLADVAAKLGLTTTSVTYYYRRKEALAVACFEEGLAAFEAMTAQAAQGSNPVARATALLRVHLEAKARIRAGERAPLPIFSDIRSLSEPEHGRLVQAYLVMLEKVADLFAGPGHAWMGAGGRTARAQLLLEQIYWTTAWLNRHPLEDYPRDTERMIDILLNGLAATGRGWAPIPLPGTPSMPHDEAGQGMFLDAATRLINARGYSGASVDEISAALNVTKGSFYHHNETKDDVVVACFKRSFAVMRNVQRLTRDLDGDAWLKLSSAAAALVEYQLSPRGPLLRSTALSALPVEIRVEMLERSSRVSEHFAGMISDGVAQGCIRPVDPYIASQMLTAMINAASDFGWLTKGVNPGQVAELYAKPLLVGLFSR